MCVDVQRGRELPLPNPVAYLARRNSLPTPDGFRPLVEASVGIFEAKMSPDGSRIAYQDGESIWVVDISTGESSEVAVGRMAAWVDDDTLIVAPDT